MRVKGIKQQTLNSNEQCLLKKCKILYKIYNLGFFYTHKFSQTFCCRRNFILSKAFIHLDKRFIKSSQFLKIHPKLFTSSFLGYKYFPLSPLSSLFIMQCDECLPSVTLFHSLTKAFSLVIRAYPQHQMERCVNYVLDNILNMWKTH